MKRTIILIFSIVFLLLGALIVAPGFMDWSKYKPQAMQQLKDTLGYDMSIDGDLSMRLIPSPRLSAGNISVKNGEEAQAAFASFERLDVHVGLWPLLKGQIAVDSVSLIKPSLSLERGADGVWNWMSPKLEAVLESNRQKNASEEGRSGNNAGGGALAAVSLESLKIEQGTLRYKDMKSGTITAFDHINLALKAESLQGPFQAEGDVSTAGRTLSFKAAIRKLDMNTRTVSLNADILSADEALSLAGVVGFGENPDFQGEVAISKKAVPALNGQSVSLKGLVTASAKAVESKDIELILGKAAFGGRIKVGLSPLVIEGRLDALEIVNLDELLPSSPKTVKGPEFKEFKDIRSSFKDIFPGSVTVPFAVDGRFDFSMPGVIYKGRTYKTVSGWASKTGGQSAIRVLVSDIPKGGQAEIFLDPTFLKKQVSKETGEETYSDFTIGLTLKGEVVDLPNLLEGFVDKSTLKRWPLWHFSHSKFSTEFSFGPNYVLASGWIKSGHKYVHLKADLQDKESLRDVLRIESSVENIDLDEWLGRGGKQEQLSQSSTTDVTAAVKNFSLPFNLDFNVNGQNLTYKGQTFKTVGLEGRYNKEEGLFLGGLGNENGLSIEDGDGNGVYARVVVKDLQNLSGIEIDPLSLSLKEPQKSAAAFGMDLSKWPIGNEPLRIDASLSGSIESLDTRADVKIAGGSVIAKGAVKNILGAPSVDKLSLQIKHPDTAKLIDALAPSAPHYASLAKPLDLQANIVDNKGVYELQGLRGIFAGTSVNGSMTLDTGARPTRVIADLTLGDLVLKTGRSTQMSGKGQSAQNPQGVSRWSSQPIDTGWMMALDAQVGVNANSIIYQNWDLQKPSLHVVLNKDGLNIQDLKAGLYGGQAAFSGLITPRSGGGKGINLKMQGSTTNVSLENLVKSLAGNAIIKGRGQINMDVNLQSAGESQQALVSALSGQGTTTGQAIAIEGMDLNRFAQALSAETKPGDTLLGLWKGTTKGGVTAFDTLDGAFSVQNGVVNVSKMDLDGPRAAIKTTGRVDLLRWLLEMAHEITLKDRPDVPPFTVKIAGPLDNPGQTFAQGALNDYLNRKINRKLEKLITDKLGLPSAQEPASAPQESQQQMDGGSGTQSQEQQAPQQQAPQEIKPEEAIRGLLEGLLQ